MALQWENLKPGMEAGTLDKGRMSTAHIMRWSAAVENWHRIHFDHGFATEHDGLPDVLVHGSWKQHVLVQAVKDVLGVEGWLWKLKFRYKGMDVANTSIRARVEVVEKQEIDGLGFVSMRVSISNQSGEVSTLGHAIGVMPLPGGPPPPYPFVPKPEYQAIRMPTDD